MADGQVPEGKDSPEDDESWSPPERPLGVRLTGAAMRGLHRAIYGAHEDDIVIVADASGDPPRPDGLDLHLDPEHPEASTVVVRRPLAGRERGSQGEASGQQGGADAG